MRLGDEPSPPWARRGRRTGGKEGPCLVGAGQSPAAAEAAEDPRARTAFPPRADGRLHGTGGQLDRHSDGACDPARRPCGPAATGEGEAPLASAAVHSAAGRQAPIPCTPPRSPSRLLRPRPLRWITPARIWPSSTSPRTRRASAAARCPSRHGVAAAPTTPPGNPRDPGAPEARGTKTCPCRGRTHGPNLSKGFVLALSPACFACLTKEPFFLPPTGL